MLSLTFRSLVTRWTSFEQNRLRIRTWIQTQQALSTYQEAFYRMQECSPKPGRAVCVTMETESEEAVKALD